METVIVQLERLQRHYELAVRSYDQIALLDLSHTLRVWVELKDVLVQLSPKFSKTPSFKSAIPPKKILRASRGCRYVFSCMPGGVVTYANCGHMASGPDFNPGKGAEIGCAMRVSEGGRSEFDNFFLISKSLDDSLMKLAGKASVKRCNYRQWLAAEVARLTYPDEHGQLKATTVSREMIVKRVANTLDGSHPSAAGKATDNRFDHLIHHLMECKMGGLPLPYFILLKIAQDILYVASKHLYVNEVLPTR